MNTLKNNEQDANEIKNYKVYVHVNKVNNKKYVGITKQTVQRRWQSGHGYHNQNKTNYFWNATTLCDILKNEVYIGNTVQNKVSVVSYKVKKLRKVEKERHIRVENTHEAIINRDVFEKAQIIHKERAKKVVKQYDYLLRGLIYCKHCRLANANCIKSKS